MRPGLAAAPVVLALRSSRRAAVPIEATDSFAGLTAITLRLAFSERRARARRLRF